MARGKVTVFGGTGFLGQRRADNEQAKEALASFYEGNEHFFWPKREFAPNAPEEVRIINDYGIVVAKYDIHNLGADTKRSLSRRKMPRHPKGERRPADVATVMVAEITTGEIKDTKRSKKGV